jgi:hypothetical protein
MQNAIAHFAMYKGELFEETNVEKEMFSTGIGADFKLIKVSRIEVIDHSKSAEDGGGRVFVKRDCVEVELSYQDDGKTLKLFIK